MVTSRLASATAIVVWLSATGCTDPEIEGKYQCTSDDDCPEDWSCGCRGGDAEQRCYSSANGFGACGVPAPPPPVTPAPPVGPPPGSDAATPPPSPPSCNILRPDCPSDQGCYPRGDGSTTGECIETQRRGLLRECSDHSQCDRGLVCLSFGGGSRRCYAVCTTACPFCFDPAVAGANEVVGVQICQLDSPACGMAGSACGNPPTGTCTMKMDLMGSFLVSE